MVEMPATDHGHGHSKFIAGLDRVLVPHGSAGLNNVFNPETGSFPDSIIKGEEAIGNQHHFLDLLLVPSFEISSDVQILKLSQEILFSPRNRELSHGVYPVGLPGPHAHHLEEAGGIFPCQPAR